MHRTLPWPRALLLGGFIALLFGGGVYGQLCSPPPRPPLVVLLNGTTRLQMTTKRPIKSIVNPKESVLQITPIERDKTTVLLGPGQGATPTFVRLELEDIDGFREIREIALQPDIEFLVVQMRKAVPLSNINIIPASATSVILTGFVNRAEDITVALQVAQNAGFQVINGLRMDGVQQVQLDVVVARVTRSKARAFGFNFLANARQNVFGSIPGTIPLNVANGQIGSAGILTPTQFGQNIIAGPGTATLFGGIISNSAGFLGFLSALETEGLAKLLSQPRLVTLSGNAASFLDGGEQAVPVPAGLGQVGVQFEEFGTRLNFLPIVLGNGRIHLEVEPEVSVLDAAAGTSIGGTVVPGRATQRLHTTVELESGQTFVLGGLIQKTVVAVANKVPVLGQMPFLGTLFSTKNFTENESELVVLVTPHLVDAQSAAQVVKVLPGQESRTPDDFELFLEGILEAPRGPRAVFVGNRYVPAHRNGPTADLFPCAGRNDGLIPRATTTSGAFEGGVFGEPRRGRASRDVEPVSHKPRTDASAPVQPATAQPRSLGSNQPVQPAAVAPHWPDQPTVDTEAPNGQPPAVPLGPPGIAPPPETPATSTIQPLPDEGGIKLPALSTTETLPPLSTTTPGR